ncbi:hypothetical protein ZHAS_00002086 [Anopheles sinensis]|uniref:Uncharacterized protein n=1 Tax=Anopheles sinensis TaxID=74873 RepID=A0A084VBS5_ANOSI|nr:hypothetical protein ZHAS_00002086 [Anopheles sinensis]
MLKPIFDARKVVFRVPCVSSEVPGELDRKVPAQFHSLTPDGVSVTRENSHPTRWGKPSEEITGEDYETFR